MTKPAAVAGSYADLKLIKSRSVAQLVIEIPIEQAEQAVAAFGIPQPGKEVAVAVALLKQSPTIEHEPRQEKRRFHDMPLPQQAALLCNDKAFARWLTGDPTVVPEEVAERMRRRLGITSRSLLATSEEAARRFIAMRDEFEVAAGRLPTQAA